MLHAPTSATVSPLAGKTPLCIMPGTDNFRHHTVDPNRHIMHCGSSWSINTETVTGVPKDDATEFQDFLKQSNTAICATFGEEHSYSGRRSFEHHIMLSLEYKEAAVTMSSCTGIL